MGWMSRTLHWLKIAWTSRRGEQSSIADAQLVTGKYWCTPGLILGLKLVSIFIVIGENAPSKNLCVMLN